MNDTQIADKLSSNKNYFEDLFFTEFTKSGDRIIGKRKIKNGKYMIKFIDKNTGETCIRVDFNLFYTILESIKRFKINVKLPTVVEFSKDRTIALESYRSCLLFFGGYMFFCKTTYTGKVYRFLKNVDNNYKKENDENFLSEDINGNLAEYEVIIRSKR